MRTFRRVYYAVTALTFAAAACFPALVPLSYRALGFDPALARTGTYTAFQVHLVTAAFRSKFVAGVLLLALSSGALSLAALLLRARRRQVDIPWPVLTLTTVGAAFVATLAVAALLVAGGGMCC
jgi:hypothetical protein